MIASTPPSKRVLDLLVPRMTELGYKYAKTGHRFRRPFAHGIFEFSLDFDARAGLQTVTAGSFVHFTKLEALFEKATGREASWIVGATLSNAGAKDSIYPVYESIYAGLTPKEKSLIDPELVHPQQRIEEAVRFILDAHEQYALPLFERVPTYRQLADFVFDGLRRKQPAYRYVYVCGWRLALILVLVRMLGDDPAELYAIADAYDAYDAYAPPEPARRWMAKVDSFYQASPADFRLD